MEDKVRENKMRRKTKRLGLILRKSKARNWSIDNYQGYMLVNSNNYIVAGQKFDLSLEQVEEFLQQYEKELRKQ